MKNHSCSVVKLTDKDPFFSNIRREAGGVRDFDLFVHPVIVVYSILRNANLQREEARSE